MTEYMVPAGYGEALHTDKKSRFIGRVWRVSDEREAVRLIEEVRASHRDAAHNVYAYIIRESGVMRFSDDGEPGGTSGMPTLNVFRQACVFDVLCVVTRYFGGILLGSGGLVRAYSAAAGLALGAAGLAKMCLLQTFEVVCAYPQYERVRRELQSCGAVIEDTSFKEDITISASIPPKDAGELAKRLSELSCGTIRPLVKGEVYRAVSIE